MIRRKQEQEALLLMIKRMRIFVIVSALAALAAVTACSHWSDKTEARASSVVACPSGELAMVAFAARPTEPSDADIHAMVDEVVRQIYGPKGLAALVKPGDKVIIKTNIVAPNAGNPGEKGRGIITDPRIVRYLAEEIRKIIGSDGTSDLKVVDATFSGSKDPSEKKNDHSFYFARLEKTGNGIPDAGDYGYDMDADGILDGTSKAELVNLDSINEKGRFKTKVALDSLGETDISLPKFLRTREQAHAQNPDPTDPDHDLYCDVFIGLPILKSHGIGGVTGALKLHYGFRWFFERFGHSGTTVDQKTGRVMKPELMDDYMVGQHLVRSYDFILMDCLTGNRAGPGSVDQKNETAVDYIFTHALLAGTDPVAIDTVEALFGGYDPKSIGSLEKAQQKGLGTNRPGKIHLVGLDAFGKHRRMLLDAYGPKKMYPFRDGWGVAKVIHDFDAPTGLLLSKLDRSAGKGKVFFYSANDSRKTDTGLARIELLANGKVIAFKNTDLQPTGTLEADLSKLPKGGKVVFQIAAWDNALNCSLSEGIE